MPRQRGLTLGGLIEEGSKGKNESWRSRIQAATGNLEILSRACWWRKSYFLCLILKEREKTRDSSVHCSHWYTAAVRISPDYTTVVSISLNYSALGCICPDYTAMAHISPDYTTVGHISTAHTTVASISPVKTWFSSPADMWSPKTGIVLLLRALPKGSIKKETTSSSQFSRLWKSRGSMW